MFKRGFFRSSVVGMALLALGACGDDGEAGTGGASDRAGPEALSGFTWNTQLTVNGIAFDFSFEFGTNTLVATNTCGVGADVLTAEVEVPVKYRYRANITNAAQAGDEACHVAAATGTIDFEIVGNTLSGTVAGQPVVFTSTGTRSGLYGDWTATLADGFTITWSMGKGKLKVSGTCPGSSATPTVTVNATYENFVEVTESGEKTVGEEGSNTCSMGITAGTLQYHFEGSTLVMLYGGQELRFKSE